MRPQANDTEAKETHLDDILAAFLLVTLVEISKCTVVPLLLPFSPSAFGASLTHHVCLLLTYHPSMNGLLPHLPLDERGNTNTWHTENTTSTSLKKRNECEHALE